MTDNTCACEPVLMMPFATYSLEVILCGVRCSHSICVESRFSSESACDGVKQNTWEKPFHVCNCFIHFAISLILLAVCLSLMQALLPIQQSPLQVISLSPAQSMCICLYDYEESIARSIIRDPRERLILVCRTCLKGLCTLLCSTCSPGAQCRLVVEGDKMGWVSQGCFPGNGCSQGWLADECIQKQQGFAILHLRQGRLVNSNEEHQ